MAFPTATGPLSGSFALEHISYSPESGGVYKLGKRALVSSCRSLVKILKRTDLGTDFLQ